jgi:hypothetical protein
MAVGSKTISKEWTGTRSGSSLNILYVKSSLRVPMSLLLFNKLMTIVSALLKLFAR